MAARDTVPTVGTVSLHLLTISSIRLSAQASTLEFGSPPLFFVLTRTRDAGTTKQRSPQFGLGCFGSYITVKKNLPVKRKPQKGGQIDPLIKPLCDFCQINSKIKKGNTYLASIL